MPRLVRAIVLAAAPGLIAALASAATPALAAPDCMTLNEARKAFPGDHLHWHGPKHCWDNVGKSARKSADVKSADAAPAPSEAAKADVATPSEKQKPAEAKSAPAERAPVVPFIANDPTALASWSAPARATAPQADEPSAQAAPVEPAAPVEEAHVVLGAPNAAPGSPDYLLEHCCWPPTVPEQAANSALLPRMAIASAGACGLAAGLWLFVYRRRRPRLHKINAAPSIFPERNSLHREAMADDQPRAADDLWQPEPPMTTLAMYAPKHRRVAADAWRGAP